MMAEMLMVTPMMNTKNNNGECPTKVIVTTILVLMSTVIVTTNKGNKNHKTGIVPAMTTAQGPATLQRARHEYQQ